MLQKLSTDNFRCFHISLPIYYSASGSCTPATAESLLRSPLPEQVLPSHPMSPSVSEQMRDNAHRVYLRLIFFRIWTGNADTFSLCIIQVHYRYLQLHEWLHSMKSPQRRCCGSYEYTGMNVTSLTISWYKISLALFSARTCFFRRKQTHHPGTRMLSGSFTLVMRKSCLLDERFLHAFCKRQFYLLPGHLHKAQFCHVNNLSPDRILSGRLPEFFYDPK